MKDLKTQCLSITLDGVNNVRFEVFTAVTMKKAVFWDVAPRLAPHLHSATSQKTAFFGFNNVLYISRTL
jgi:hypothetical protein